MTIDEVLENHTRPRPVELPTAASTPPGSACSTTHMADRAVHAEGVVKRFGETRRSAGVDLDVAEGTVFGLLGPNGAGKTRSSGCSPRC